MPQVSVLPVEFVWEGDFCHEDCEWRSHDLNYCIVHGEELKIHKMDDPIVEYVHKAKPRTYEAPLRCKGCLEAQPSMGLYRKLPGGVRVFPTAKQIVDGEWVACDKLLDLRKAMKGWSIRLEYCWHFLEEDDVEMCDVKFSARKGAKGKIRELGTAQSGFSGLQELPKAAREAFMVWASTVYDEIVDIEKAETDALWEEQNG